MIERYKKLYHLEHRYYASQAPVLIESGALLQRQSGAVLCQLCFRSIQDRPIRSLRAVIQMLDSAGLPFGNPVDHRYQDLDLQREDTCGRDIAIVLPSSQVSAFTARVSQVTFDDGDVWTDAGASWEPLPDQYTLEDHFTGEAELRRFLHRFGEDCSFAPLETEELWFCTCGAVNPIGDGRCHRCRRKRSALFGRETKPLSPETREEAAFHRGAPGARRAPFPWSGLVIGAAALALAGLLAWVLIPRLPSLSAAKSAQSAREAAPVSAPSESTASPAADLRRDAQQQAYQDALALQSKADYALLEDSPPLYLAAAEAFEALGDYKDSRSLALQCRKKLETHQETLSDAAYQQAQALLDQRRYGEARLAFLSLGDYRDSADLARESLYRKALALYQYIEDHDVRGFTASLSADPDTASLVSLPREQLLRLGVRGLEELGELFGADPVLFSSAEEASDQVPIQLAVAGLLEPLEDYKDSRELAAKLPDMIDRSDEFFALCASGDLEGAQDWLESWDRPFEDKGLWLERIQRYLPYCGSWELLSGDPSLVSSVGGTWEKVYSLRCRVSLTPDGATLCFLLHEGDETGPELYAGLEEGRFLLHPGQASFVAQLNRSGSLSVIKVQNNNITGGVEFVRK